MYVRTCRVQILGPKKRFKKIQEKKNFGIFQNAPTLRLGRTGRSDLESIMFGSQTLDSEHLRQVPERFRGEEWSFRVPKVRPKLV